MIQRNHKQIRGRGKSRTRASIRTTSRGPRVETERYAHTPNRLSLFTDPPRDKEVYSIGELVTVAYERAALLADDAATEAMVATRLLAEWLVYAHATTQLAGSSTESEEPRRKIVPRQAGQRRTQRGPSRTGTFANAPGFRAAA